MSSWKWLNHEESKLSYWFDGFIGEVVGARKWGEAEEGDQRGMLLKKCIMSLVFSLCLSFWLPWSQQLFSPDTFYHDVSTWGNSTRHCPRPKATEPPPPKKNGLNPWKLWTQTIYSSFKLFMHLLSQKWKLDQQLYFVSLCLKGTMSFKNWRCVATLHWTGFWHHFFPPKS